jgi:hypothetical protein
MVCGRFVFAHPGRHKRGRRNVMKLIGIYAKEPITITHLLPGHVKHVSAQTRLGKIDRLFANRHNPFFT